MTCNHHRREKQQLVEELMNPKNDSKPIPVLTQETLLITGDKDNVFPLSLAYQLQRHLGPNSRLEIVKDAGHAANIDSPDSLTICIGYYHPLYGSITSTLIFMSYISLSYPTYNSRAGKKFDPSVYKRCTVAFSLLRVP